MGRKSKNTTPRGTNASVVGASMSDDRSSIARPLSPPSTEDLQPSPFDDLKKVVQSEIEAAHPFKRDLDIECEMQGHETVSKFREISCSKSSVGVEEASHAFNDLVETIPTTVEKMEALPVPPLPSMGKEVFPRSVTFASVLGIVSEGRSTISQALEAVDPQSITAYILGVPALALSSINSALLSLHNNPVSPEDGNPSISPELDAAICKYVGERVREIVELAKALIDLDERDPTDAIGRVEEVTVQIYNALRIHTSSTHAGVVGPSMPTSTSVPSASSSSSSPTSSPARPMGTSSYLPNSPADMNDMEAFLASACPGSSSPAKSGSASEKTLSEEELLTLFRKAKDQINLAIILCQPAVGRLSKASEAFEVSNGLPLAHFGVKQEEGEEEEKKEGEELRSLCETVMADHVEAVSETEKGIVKLNAEAKEALRSLLIDRREAENFSRNHEDAMQAARAATNVASYLSHSVCVASGRAKMSQIDECVSSLRKVYVKELAVAQANLATFCKYVDTGRTLYAPLMKFLEVDLEEEFVQDLRKVVHEAHVLAHELFVCANKTDALLCWEAHFYSVALHCTVRLTLEDAHTELMSAHNRFIELGGDVQLLSYESNPATRFCSRASELRTLRERIAEVKGVLIPALWKEKQDREAENSDSLFVVKFTEPLFDHAESLLASSVKIHMNLSTATPVSRNITSLTLKPLAVNGEQIYSVEDAVQEHIVAPRRKTPETVRALTF